MKYPRHSSSPTHNRPRNSVRSRNFQLFRIFSQTARFPGWDCQSYGPTSPAQVDQSTYPNPSKLSDWQRGGHRTQAGRLSQSLQIQSITEFGKGVFLSHINHAQNDSQGKRAGNTQWGHILGETKLGCRKNLTMKSQRHNTIKVYFSQNQVWVRRPTIVAPTFSVAEAKTKTEGVYALSTALAHSDRRHFPLKVYWPELVTWLQLTCKGAWEI